MGRYMQCMENQELEVWEIQASTVEERPSQTEYPPNL